MLPFCNGNVIMTSLVGQDNGPEILNDDLAHHLKTAPAPMRASWPMRLLPASIRETIKARKAARDYERSLICMWETSPHLLDDIGIVVLPGQKISADQAAAPHRVTGHVLERTAQKTAVTFAEPQTVTTRAARAPAPRIWAKAPVMVAQGGVPA